MPRLPVGLDHHPCNAPEQLCQRRHTPSAAAARSWARLERAQWPCQTNGSSALSTLVTRSTVRCTPLSLASRVRTLAAQWHRTSSTTSERLDAPLLTALIKQCHDLHSIQRLLQQHRSQLNHIHASAMVVRFAHLAANDGSAPHEATAEAAQAAAAAPPAAAIVDEQAQLLHLVLDVLDLISSHLQHYQGRQVANTLWALSRLAPVALQAPASQIVQTNGTGPWAASPATTAAALAAAVAWPGAASTGQMPQSLSARLPAVAHQLQACCEDHWHSFTVAEVAMMLHAAAALNNSGLWATDPAWLQQCLAQLDELLQNSKQQQEGTQQHPAQQQQQQGQRLQPKRSESQQAGHLTAQDQAVIWLALQQLHLRPPVPLQQQLLACALASAVRYTARDAANMLHAQAALKVNPDAQWLAAWLSATQPALHRASGRDLCSMLYALACMRHTPPASWLDACLAALQSSFNSCSFHELSLGMYALARLRARPAQPWLQKVLDATTARLGQAGQQEAAMLLWALARLHCYPHQAWMQALLHRFVSTSTAGGDAGAGRNVAGVLWALGRMRYLPPAVLLRQLVSALPPEELRTAAPQSLACFIHGLALLRCRPPRWWLSSYLQAVGGAARDMTPQGLALVLWSLAVMQVHPNDRWLNSICEHVHRHLEDTGSSAGASSAQAAALILWALAKMGHRPDWHVLQAVLDTVMLPASSGGVLPQSVALTAYACARLGAARAGGQVWQLLFVTAPQLPAYKPQDISNILWALGTLRQPPPEGWLQDMYACTASGLQQFTSQQLANAAWGLLRLRVAAPPQQWTSALAAEQTTRQEGQLGTRIDHATLLYALRRWQMDVSHPCLMSGSGVVDLIDP